MGGTPFGWLGWAGLGWPCRLKKHVFSFKSLLKYCSFWSFRGGDPFRLAGLGWSGLAWCVQLGRGQGTDKEKEEEEEKETSRRRSRPKLYTQTPDQPPQRPLMLIEVSLPYL